MMDQSSATTAIPAADVLALCVDVLRAFGVSEAHARSTAEALVATDCWGIFTHGTKLLPGYVRRIRAGGIRTDVEPAVTRQGPAWAIVDARSTLGQVSSSMAMAVAITKARGAGVGYVGVRDGNHFGAAGYYAWLAAREGMIGMAMANDIPSVAAPGSRTAVTGSNPIAYALPAGPHDPILFDAATSTVAGGKVYAARTRGDPIPPDWLIGPDGLPTTDASLYPQKAVLTPMAGHKGYGIALLVESLAGILTGAAVTWQVGSWIFDDPARPTNHGAAFLAFDVAAVLGERVYLERVDALIREIRATPTAPGVSRVLLPGEREWKRRREYAAEGIPLPGDVREGLRKLAGEAGVAHRGL
jgi:LDH2 family malate/lactate/ureidoglycolate dehydrogenase